MDFATTFKALTGNEPFPWQEALYVRFVSDRPDNIPASCNLPTGLGKTSVIAIWLIALANHPDKMPRRLVYVVNRRTVVDQTTVEVEKYVWPLKHNGPPVHPALLDLSELLRKRLSDQSVSPLALSTLRGQFADNRQWSEDPSRPAVICGTVDMIGSRLLFSGYGIGVKSKPLHAGFLGQDALLVHDEAHLEPAFQELLIAIEKEQKRCNEFGTFRVMELTATSRGSGEVFTLTKPDLEDPIVEQRVRAKKKLNLIPANDPKSPADQLVSLALQRTGAVLVFVRRVDDVDKIVKKLPKGSYEQLTGTLRGLERDGLVKKPIFQRFLPESNRDKDVPLAEGTVYLVCTSAGEVGVNISADHLVCDLSTFDSMAQRFGRVNRFGLPLEHVAQVDVIHPASFESDELNQRQLRSLGLLDLLRGDGCPATIGELRDRAIRESTTPSMATDGTKALRDYIIANPGKDPIVASFAPPPTILPVTDILFDSWALTSIRGKLPGRPMVEPYLHGLTDDTSHDTNFAWREEVSLFSGKVDREQLQEFIDEYPLKPHEQLHIPTFGKRSAYDHLEAIRSRKSELPVWVIEPDDELLVFDSLDQLLEKRGKDYKHSLAVRTVVLPPAAGGLTDKGTLDGSTPPSEAISYDVAGLPMAPGRPLYRLKVVHREDELELRLVAPVREWQPEIATTLPDEPLWKAMNIAMSELGLPRMKLALVLDCDSGVDQPTDGALAKYIVLREIPPKKAQSDREWPALDSHLKGVREAAVGICKGLRRLDPKLAAAVEAAAAWHDLGKGRAVWQRGAGNVDKHTPVAKTLHGRAPENLNHYRHELGSLVDVQSLPEFQTAMSKFDEDQRELVLHLIATHHGRGRPHFPSTEQIDPERTPSLTQPLVMEVPRRFARLQRQYGRWGLAYLESLLRAADAIESKRIQDAPLADSAPGVWPPLPTAFLPNSTATMPKASISVKVDPTNPGQFFACCGLLELADRLWPGAEGWFAEQGAIFHVSCDGSLKDILTRLMDLKAVPLQRVECNDIVIKPILAPLRLDLTEDNSFTLDSWMRFQIVKGVPTAAANTPWNFWSGRQTSMGIWSGLHGNLRLQLAQVEESRLNSLFSIRKFQKGRFGFDPGPAWNALDVGFSPNEHDMAVESSSAVEMLAAIGLQRFRPMMLGRESFEYAIWETPMSPVAAAAFSCGFDRTTSMRFRGCVVSRGEYSALGFSSPTQGEVHE